MGTSQLGPPITVTIDGKQYIFVAGGPPGASAFGQAPPGQRAPAHLFALELDGKTPLPTAPPPAQAPAQ